MAKERERNDFEEIIIKNTEPHPKDWMTERTEKEWKQKNKKGQEV